MNIININSYIKLLIFCLILKSCASSGTLSGGKRDKTPPKLELSKSSQNSKLNCKDKKFEFVFDEFVEVKEVLKEVLVSPPLIYFPKVKSRGKKVVFEFNEKEVLRDSTTYIINFGESIRDFTEGNRFPFKYIFSTGSNIDSFRLKGKVIDISKNTGAANAIVMLYDDLKDSIVLKKKPYYSSKTDSNGEYEIQNIKPGKYRLISIKDDNQSYTYNEPKEMLAFADDFVVLKDSVTLASDLEISLPEEKIRSIGFNKDHVSRYGIKLNTPINYSLPYDTKPSLTYRYLEQKADSLILWYKDDALKDSIDLLLPFDTLTLFLNKGAKPLKKLLLSSQFSTLSNSIKDTLILNASIPIASVNKNFWKISDTSGVDIDFKILKIGEKECGFYSQKFVNKQLYKLTILPGGITDIFDNINDTITNKINFIEKVMLSQIDITIEDLDSTKIYEVSLIGPNQKKVWRTQIENRSSFTINKTNLSADEYKIYIFEDNNKNGRKDASNYWLKRQAEKDKEFVLEKLKEDRLLEKTFSFKSSSGNTQQNVNQLELGVKR
ncbi:MAG: hypothetical protein RLZZ546_542 [Bacteroidota bacterium]|jgi:hypothetical protein